MMRRARLIALVPAVALCLPGLVGCSNKNEGPKKLVMAALNATLRTPRAFTYVDQDLAATTTVTGQVADDNRYQLLLSGQDGPVWQQVAVDDAIADYFPATAAVATYSGAGSSPALNVLKTYASIRSLLPPAIAQRADAVYATKLPRAVAVPNSLALAALRAGKWVLDPLGAPKAANPNAADADKQALANPFFGAQTELARARDIIQATDFFKIKEYRAGDLAPTYKRTDDPFPAPGPGVHRYDLKQPDLPTAGLNTATGVPAPPSEDVFRKLAIYIQDGRVIAVRINEDVLDRLNDVSQLYRIPLHLKKDVGVELEEAIGQVTIDLLQGAKDTVPFRVHQETLLMTFPKNPPAIALPAVAVRAPLTLLPGQSVAAVKPPGST